MILVSRNEPRELENIVARDLDVLIENFVLQVQKKDGEQYEPTLLLFQALIVIQERKTIHNHYGRKGVPKNERCVSREAK